MQKAITGPFKRVKNELNLMVLFHALFLTASLYFLFQVNIESLSFELKLTTIIGVLFYLVSHLLRAARTWIIISDRYFRISDAATMQFNSSFIGNTFNSLVGDLSKILFFGPKWNKGFYKIILVLVFLRSFDLALMGIFLFYNAKVGLYNNMSTLFLIFLLAFLSISSLSMLPRVGNAISCYLIKYYHNNFSIKTVRIINSFSQTYQRMKLNKIEIVFLVLLLSLAIWILELISLIFIFKQGKFENSMESFNILLENVLYHTFTIQGTKVMANDPYWILDLSLLITSILLLFKKKRII